MPTRSYHIRGLIKAIGPVKAAEILIRRAVRITHPVPVAVHGCELQVRPCDSDLFVLSQVFGQEEYKVDGPRLETLHMTADRIVAEGYTPVIVDAGANVGYSTLYFSNLFPQCVVMAIEPCDAAFSILVAHTHGNDKIIPIHAALWSHGNGVSLTDRGSGSWSHRSTEGAGTPSVRLDVLLSSVPRAKPFIVKLDIEGAEREVVESCANVFAEARCILIEPHDFMFPGAACLTPLFRVLASASFDTILSGENLMLFAN